MMSTAGQFAFQGGSIIGSTDWMVLHRPVELAPLIGQMKTGGEDRLAKGNSACSGVLKWFFSGIRLILEKHSRAPKSSTKASPLDSSARVAVCACLRGRKRRLNGAPSNQHRLFAR